MFELTGIIQWIYNIIAGISNSIGLPEIILDIVLILIITIAIFAFLMLMALYLIWMERKVSAHIQDRLGPMMTGWHGWAQTIADSLKLLQKEDIIVASADRKVHYWAPIVAFMPCFAVFAVIPFGKGLIAADVNIGIMYILAITTFTTLSFLMAGWGTNNKYALLGGMRSASQIISYEVPLTISILGVVMMAGTLSMGQFVELQGPYIWKWYIWPQFLGFCIYLIASTAELNRTPFDLPEAEQELVAGFNIEYSGMKFAMFFLAEFLNMFAVGAVTTTLFLGGWNPPFPALAIIPSWVWFLGKSLFIVFVIMWFKWTYPRLRVDHLLAFAWKVLLPLAFLNLILTAIGITIF
jgi:NADH-quinone oxidoreductase subunit H